MKAVRYGVFGGMRGFGAEQPGLTQAEAYISENAKKYRFVNPSVRPALDAALQRYIVFWPNLNLVLPPEGSGDPKSKEASAWGWVQQEVSKGNVVFASTSTLLALLTNQPLTEGNDKLGTLEAGTPAAQEAAKSPIGVIIGGDPDEKPGLLSYFTTPVGMAVAGAAALGIGYVLMKKKGGYLANADRSREAGVATGMEDKRYAKGISRDFFAGWLDGVTRRV